MILYYHVDTRPGLYNERVYMFKMEEMTQPSAG